MRIKNDQRGIAHVAIVVLVVVVIGVLGLAGWKVWDNSQKKDQKTATTKNIPQSSTTNEKNNVAVAPEGWVQYNDTTNGISFYYPPSWDKSKFHIYRNTVSEAVKGTNFGPYAVQYIFKKPENKWYFIDFEGNQVAPPSDYTTSTTIPATTYPVVYGYNGEGGGSAYYVAFTSGTYSYLIELPVINELSDSLGLNAQKAAIVDLLNSIKIIN